MKTLIFMNEALHTADQLGAAVITVQQDRERWHVSEVDIKASALITTTEVHIRKHAGKQVCTVIGRTCKLRFDPAGCKDIRTHGVRAWLEVE